ncbi:MAG: hypothetical protein ACNA8W_12330 [Bradymonadaceae bacterium]
MAHHESEHGHEHDPDRELTSSTETRGTGTAETYDAPSSSTSTISMEPTGWRFSWSAIFAGTFTALVVLALLNLLGLAIGAAVIDPVGGIDGEGLGIGAGLWYTISGLVALFFGGWVAGRIGGGVGRYESFLYGIVTWGVVSVVTLFFLTTAMGQILGGAFGVVGQTFAAATEVPAISQALEGQLAEAGVTEQQIAQIEAGAAQVGADVANVIAIAAFWAFIAMLLGGLLAAWGSNVGARSLLHEDRLPKERPRRYVGRVRHA